MNQNTHVRLQLRLSLVLAVLFFCNIASASDWPRFHGPDGSGVSLDKRPLPVTWSETENLKWKAKLPGPGSSSPIVVGSRVVVTCWTGYHADPDHDGEEKDLRRHAICFDRNSGKMLWDRVVEPVLPEDPFSGQLTQNGYASHTPTSDGKRIYVFFGKTGVLAFDLDGKKLWQTSVGDGLGASGWGTASSPIVYKKLVIVTASAESKSLVALNQEDGKEVWRYKDNRDNGLHRTWSTPVLVDCGHGRTDLVIALPYEIWGFDPDTGKRLWHCKGLDDDTCSSVVARDGIVYALETGPLGGGTMAVRAGGAGDVSNTRVLWRGKERSRIATPVVDSGRIYFVNNRAANCIDAASGKLIYKAALTGVASAAEPAPGGAKPNGPRPGKGRSGAAAGIEFSSPVVADGKIYFVLRCGDAYVYAAGAEFKFLAKNSFAGGSGDFSSTPAISDGQLFIRSSKFLYCVALREKTN
jgi:outer membrane protein assembly factor BamB